ncbi:MAG: WxL domain-containing protein [Candidatus Latescibacterota bacterium]|jgi:hypothetical protein
MRSTARTLTIGALSVGALLFATSAFAADSVTQAVTGGTLTASVADLALVDVTSTHADQPSTGTMVLAADDSTGTGAGWNVTEQVTSFAYSGTNAGTAIPAANFAITSVAAVTSSAGQVIDVTGTDLAPTGPQSGNITAGVTGSLDTPVTVLRAGATYGQGTYGQGINVTLTVPAESRAGTYTGTLTTTVTAAP